MEPAIRLHDLDRKSNQRPLRAWANTLTTENTAQGGKRTLKGYPSSLWEFCGGVAIINDSGEYSKRNGTLGQGGFGAAEEGAE